MILDFDSFLINESSIKKLKKELHGVLGHTSRQKMKKVLRKYIVTFKFTKRDGSIRTAHGTLHPSYLPALRGGSPKPEHQVVYYDLDKGHWRSFRSFKFINIIDVKPIGSSTGSSSHSSKHSTTSKHTSSVSSKPVSKPKTKSDEDDEEISMKKVSSEVEKTPKKEKHNDEVITKKSEKEIKKDVKHNDHNEKEEIKKDDHKDVEKDVKKDKSDEHTKEYKKGDKIPEDELVRRSADFRKDSRKNKHTKESNDKFKKKIKDKENKKEKDEDE